MSYGFRDVTEVVEESALPYLPSEALQLNGEYLEDLISGYRTLNVTGREALGKEITASETGIRDGSTLQSSRYPGRVITVTYQLIAKSNELYREAYNTLAGLLKLDESELTFVDESDKFFIGTCTDVAIPEAGTNAVVGTLEFTCTDPYKYSIEEYTATPSVNSGVYTVTDNFLEEIFIEGSSDSEEDEIIGLIEMPVGDYASFYMGQVLTYPVSDSIVTAIGEDAELFTFGTDYVLDSVNKTVYITEEMASDDVSISGWQYHTVSNLAADNMAQFAIDYNGTAPAYPELVANFPEGSENTDGTIGEDACGYVAFVDDEKHIIQIGNPGEEDEETESVSGITSRYTNWSSKKGTSYWVGSSAKHHGSDYALGSLGYASWKLANKNGGGKKVVTKGTGKNKRKVTVYTNPSSGTFFRPSCYRSSGQTKVAKDKWYGPTILCALPNDSAGNSGAKNFTFTWEQLFATTNNKQQGRFDVVLVNNTGGVRKIVAGILISKYSDGANANLSHYVNDTYIKGINTTVNVQQYNTRFGFSKKIMKKVKSKNKKKYKWVYNGWSKPTRVSTISKNGQTITFNIAGIKHTYKDATITNTFVNEIFISFIAKSGHSPVAYNGIQNAKFFNKTPEIDVDIKNTFCIGDEVIADCRDGSIELNGEDTPSLGALGNDWETFKLENGANNIMATWSDWASGKPNVSLKYREVFL